MASLPFRVPRLLLLSYFLKFFNQKNNRLSPHQQSHPGELYTSRLLSLIYLAFEQFENASIQSHFIKQRVAVAPVFLHLHKQLEMDAMAHQLFDVSPRIDSDLFQTARAFANHDLLL